MSFFQTSKDEQIIDNDKRSQEWQTANASICLKMRDVSFLLHLLFAEIFKEFAVFTLQGALSL